LSLPERAHKDFHSRKYVFAGLQKVIIFELEASGNRVSCEELLIGRAALDEFLEQVQPLGRENVRLLHDETANFSECCSVDTRAYESKNTSLAAGANSLEYSSGKKTRHSSINGMRNFDLLIIQP
jgi:hypothetical protein